MKARASIGVAVLVAFIVGAVSGAVWVAKGSAPTSSAAVAAKAGYQQAAARAPVIVQAPGSVPDLSKVVATPLPARRDLECLTDAVYYEARGESAVGQAAVAQVVLNRSRHPDYPKSVCGVVFQGVRAGACQFSFVCDGAMRQPLEHTAWGRARAIANRALSGYVMAAVGPAIRFHVTHVAWSDQNGAIARIGNHLFLGKGHPAPSVISQPAAVNVRAASDKIVVALVSEAGAARAAPAQTAD